MAHINDIFVPYVYNIVIITALNAPQYSDSCWRPVVTHMAYLQQQYEKRVIENFKQKKKNTYELRERNLILFHVNDDDGDDNAEGSVVQYLSPFSALHNYYYISRTRLYYYNTATVVSRSIASGRRGLCVCV